VARIAQKSGGLLAKLENARDERRVVPFARALFQIGGAGRRAGLHRVSVRFRQRCTVLLARPRAVGMVDMLAQSPILGVLQHRDVTRRLQRELPARLPVALSRRAGRLQDVVRNTGKHVATLNIHRECVGGVENVLREASRETGEFLGDLREAFLLVGGQFRAGQPEIAQLVVDNAALRRVEPRVLFACAQRLVLRE